MKKLGKILLWIVVTLVVLLAVGISLTIGWRPFIGPRARPSLRATSSALRNGWSAAGISSLRPRDAKDAIPCTTGIPMAARSCPGARVSVR